MNQVQSNITTVYDMVRDTLKIVRQIRFGFIALTIALIISVLIAIGSIGHTNPIVLHCVPKSADDVISSRLRCEIIELH
jgi:hypothetical protein